MLSSLVQNSNRIFFFSLISRKFSVPSFRRYYFLIACLSLSKVTFITSGLPLSPFILFRITFVILVPRSVTHARSLTQASRPLGASSHSLFEASLLTGSMIKIALAGTSGLAQYIAHYISTQTYHQFFFLSRNVSEHTLPLFESVPYVDRCIHSPVPPYPPEDGKSCPSTITTRATFDTSLLGWIRSSQLSRARHNCR